MSDVSPRRWIRRLLLAAAALFAFTLASLIGARLAVDSFSRMGGNESSKATGLGAVDWDSRSVWSPLAHSAQPLLQKTVSSSNWISRNAELVARSSSFENSVQELHRTVAAHHGYLDKLFTQSRSGVGRVLAATLAVPSNDFDATLSDVKKLGRVEAISESGEDTAVKVASGARHLAAAQSTLARLEKLQHERKGELRDAVALEREISQANEAVTEAERQHEDLVTHVDLSYIQLTLMEEYRAPLETHFSEAVFHLRNALVEGFGAIFYSLSLFLGLFFEFGLPILFWFAILFWPGRLAWRRFRPATTP
jgi:Domain of unknown function (DUF4349)